MNLKWSTFWIKYMAAGLENAYPEPLAPHMRDTKGF